MSRLALVPILALTACPEVSSTANLFGSSVTAFDSRLPDAIEEVFESCHGELAFSASGAATTNMAGSCQDASKDDWEDLSEIGQGIATAWGFVTIDTRTPMASADMSDAAALHQAYGNVVREGFGDWEWEDATLRDHQCSTYLDWRDLAADSLVIDDLEAEWVIGASAPTLKVTMQFSDTAPLASGYLGFSVDCDGHLLREMAVNSMLPDDDDYEIRLDDLEVQILFRLTSVSGGEPAWTVSSSSSISGVHASPGFPADFRTNVGTLEELMEEHGDMSPEDLAGDIEDAMRDAMSPLTSLLSEQITSQVPAGNEICSVSVNSEYEVVYVVSKPEC